MRRRCANVLALWGPSVVALLSEGSPYGCPAACFLGPLWWDQGYRRKLFARLWADDGDALGAVYLVEGVIDYSSSYFFGKLFR